jgi:16S rRNA processing protein RimM
MDNDSLVLIGKIAATHGIKGQLRIRSYSGHYDSLLSVDSITLKEPSGRIGTFGIASAKMQGKKLVVALNGLANINCVEHLVGSDIYLRKNQLPDTDEGEYYWHDLIGLHVVTDAGELLGILQSIIETGSNDVYVVKSAHRELLIPALEDVIKSIDLSAGVMTVTPSEGFFDL